ncbi:hypothetical protein RB195_017262 [Necator americanus]|uniref:Thioredoxin domain-containing protein n=1 Tax=Necator americanus TaxID=51031 RepID=A0ABR1C6Z2_NECAM
MPLMRIGTGPRCKPSREATSQMQEKEKKDEFDAILKENPDSLVIIDFYATWCGPCKIMGPKFAKLSNEYTSVVFVKVDVDESEDIVSRFDIKVMPTFVFMRKGAQIDLVEGSVEDDLRKKIEQHNFLRHTSCGLPRIGLFSNIHLKERINENFINTKFALLSL